MIEVVATAPNEFWLHITFFFFYNSIVRGGGHLNLVCLGWKYQKVLAFIVYFESKDGIVETGSIECHEKCVKKCTEEVYMHR